MIKFHDPRGRVGTEIDVYELAHDIRANNGSGVTVGLLANGFPDSEVFMTKIASALHERLPNIKTRLWNKGNAGIPANDKLLAEITSSCQVAISAYGH
ncbi:MAG: hypothetical protein OXC84_07090 [Gammaproteobacteria bacterium]|nr:hypothetical protein [Gammaproteobacteria bacterium]